LFHPVAPIIRDLIELALLKLSEEKEVAFGKITYSKEEQYLKQ